MIKGFNYRKKSKLIALVLMIVMTFTVILPTNAFAQNEPTIGTQINRAEFISMIVNEFGFTEKAEIKFTDVPTTATYYEALQKAVKAGLIKGFEDGKFRPNNPITAADATVILARAKAASAPATQENPTSNQASLTDVEKLMVEKIDAKKAELLAISMNIWTLKEPGWKEVESAALLTNKLEQEGFTVQRGLTGKNADGTDREMPTAFSATFEGVAGGPTVAMLLEYDALPNGHSCGHNLIAQTGLTAALGLKEALATTPGKIIVYGTPSEEYMGAKPLMVAAGYFDDVDVVFTTHGMNDWSTEVKYKAMNGTNVTFEGLASHASAAPWSGRSALDAAMLMGQGFEFMREHMYETDRVHYAILEGGKAANVVPDISVVQLYVRSDDTAQLKKMLLRADEMIKASTMMTETKATYAWGTSLLSATQVPRLYDFAAKSAVALGEVPYSKFKFNTMPAGSSDAGNIAYVVPTVQFAFPLAADKVIALHSNEAAEATKSEYAMNNSHLAGKMMAVAAYRVMTNPAELAAIKAEFDKNFK